MYCSRTYTRLVFTNLELNALRQHEKWWINYGAAASLHHILMQRQIWKVTSTKYIHYLFKWEKCKAMVEQQLTRIGTRFLVKARAFNSCKTQCTGCCPMVLLFRFFVTGTRAAWVAKTYEGGKEKLVRKLEGSTASYRSRSLENLTSFESVILFQIPC